MHHIEVVSDKHQCETEVPLECLDGRELQDWVDRRSFANRWIRSFDWPEMAPINVAQKNMDDDRYGRERQLVDALGHNSLTTNATARLFHEIFAGDTFSRDSRLAMQDLLARRHDPAWDLSVD